MADTTMTIPHYFKKTETVVGGALIWLRMDGMSCDNRTGWGFPCDVWVGVGSNYGYIYCGG